eukprot:m.142167 g.142167  ORF g.142167 m.142167 type:complete len:139 (-) comp17674_c0_seq3:223-639(-)
MYRMLSGHCLTRSWFLRTFKHSEGSRTVVNVSSLLAVKPFKAWGMYAMAKSGRDMLFSVIAAEEPAVAVLNYAPGPLDTAMQAEVRRSLCDEEQRSLYASMHVDGKLVTADASAKILIKLICAKNFTSGAHVDYYDCI